METLFFSMSVFTDGMHMNYIEINAYFKTNILCRNLRWNGKNADVALKYIDIYFYRCVIRHFFKFELSDVGLLDVVGNVWIYRTYGMYQWTDKAAANYCNRELYLFSFWITSAIYIMFACLCCCGILASVITYCCLGD